MDLQHIDFGLELKQVSDAGGFEGYASTRAVDRGNDIVAAGAFRDSLNAYSNSGRMPKMLWQHNPNHVVGVWKEMYEDDHGLFVKGEVITETTMGGDLHKLMRRGAIDTMSIGYRTIDADYEGGDAKVRRINKLELWEVSLVTFPMNPEAVVTAVKRLHSVGDVERILRDAGVPAACAKLVANHGYKAAMQKLGDRRDGEAELEPGDLDRLLTAIRA